VRVFIVDASVALKWFLNEVHTEAARRLFNPRHTLCVPDLFLLEMDNAFLKKSKRKEITEKDSKEARALLRGMPLRFYPTSQLLDQAYTLALKNNSSLDDAVYLALALQLNGQLVTADQRLANSLSGGPQGKHVLWVEDMKGPD